MADLFKIGDRVLMKESAPTLFDAAADRKAAQRIVDGKRVGIITHTIGGQCVVLFERSRLEWQVTWNCLAPAALPSTTTADGETP